jgi:nucleotide-binding universal stress UspA family protein
MTTRGRGVVRETLLGSVAEDVVRTSVAPVLLVGPNVSAGWRLGDDPLILAGLDGSTPSLAAAHAAGELARGIDARVRVVEVLRPSDVVTVGEFPGGDLAMLEEVAAELGRGGVTADYRMVDGYDAAETLARLATEDRATAISVASHGRSGLARVVLGSVAVRTIRQAPCPVLVTGPAVHRYTTDGARPVG